MADQVETFIGWTGLGFGVLLAYGAYKNKPILGPSGLVTTSLTTGHIPGSTAPKSGTAGNAPPKASPVKPKAGKVLPSLGDILFGPKGSRGFGGLFK